MFFPKFLSRGRSLPSGIRRMSLQGCRGIPSGIRRMSFRTYPSDPTSSVYQHYFRKNTEQTLSRVLEKQREYQNRPKISLSVSEVLSRLHSFVDPSDPDTEQDNRVHAYQCAESIRKEHPEDTAYQVTGLIHDVGKILFTWGEPEAWVVGDTFPVGCAFSPKCVYSEFFRFHPDNGKYDALGIYSAHCGLDALHFTWGHDEYLYQVLKQNREKHRLPEKFWRLLRYHSFYPLHREGAYTQFLEQGDFELVKQLQEFSGYDLYSKKDEVVLNDISEGKTGNNLLSYYEHCLTYYFPQKLLW